MKYLTILLATTLVLLGVLTIAPHQKVAMAANSTLFNIPADWKACADNTELPEEVCQQQNDDRLEALINFVANIVFGVVGTITVIVIIVSGIQMSASAGNPDAIKSAKNKLVAAITSLVLLIAMAVIFNLIGFQVT